MHLSALSMLTFDTLIVQAAYQVLPSRKKWLLFLKPFHVIAWVEECHAPTEHQFAICSVSSHNEIEDGFLALPTSCSLKILFHTYKKAL